ALADLEHAAGIDHVGHVPRAVGIDGSQHGFGGAADDFGGVVAIEQGGAQAVLAHGADAVGEQQPAGVGQDRAATIADLDEFQRSSRSDLSRNKFFPSWRPTIMYLPPIFSGNSAMPLLRPARPSIGSSRNRRKSTVRSSSERIEWPEYAV